MLTVYHVVVGDRIGIVAERKGGASLLGDRFVLPVRLLLRGILDDQLVLRQGEHAPFLDQAEVVQLRLGPQLFSDIHLAPARPTADIILTIIVDDVSIFHIPQVVLIVARLKLVPDRAAVSDDFLGLTDLVLDQLAPLVLGVRISLDDDIVILAVLEEAVGLLHGIVLARFICQFRRGHPMGGRAEKHLRWCSDSDGTIRAHIGRGDGVQVEIGLFVLHPFVVVRQRVSGPVRPLLVDRERDVRRHRLAHIRDDAVAGTADHRVARGCEVRHVGRGLAYLVAQLRHAILCKASLLEESCPVVGVVQNSSGSIPVVKRYIFLVFCRSIMYANQQIILAHSDFFGFFKAFIFVNLTPIRIILIACVPIAYCIWNIILQIIFD